MHVDSCDMPLAASSPLPLPPCVPANFDPLSACVCMCVQGYVLGVAGQPEDHPYPAACEELRYLKFAMYRLEG